MKDTLSETERLASRVPETARPGREACAPQEWAWVERSVWTERMLAALGNGVRGGKWFSLMDKVSRRRTLEVAWQQVARNRGAAGVDAVSVERFRAHEERYLGELEAQLQDGSYRPSAVRRVWIPKSGGGERPLGIPVVKDRVVQGALKLVLEPIFEREFMPHSYGFRPGRSTKDALREVAAALKAGHAWVVDADLKSYFDSIPHDRLLARIGERVSDGAVLGLIERFLEQEVMDGLERWTPQKGSPQGAVLSPLLANLYLHELDVRMAERGYRLVRYADDFVILCRSAEVAEQALAEVRAWVAEAGLELHPDKTHVGDWREPGQGFEFLGYRFDGGHRWVRRKSLQAFKDRVRVETRRTRGKSLEQVIARLNPMLKGWFAYFQHADRRTFPRLDGWVRRRLRALLRKQQKRPGHGICKADHRRWPNAFFAQRGLFTLKEAYAMASQSRC